MLNRKGRPKGAKNKQPYTEKFLNSQKKKAIKREHKKIKEGVYPDREYN